MEEIILQENKKVNNEAVAYEKIDYEINENDLYEINDKSLDENKEKTEWCKREFESELEI